MKMIGWGAGVDYGTAEHLIVFITAFVTPDRTNFHFLEYAGAFPQTKLFLRDDRNCQFEHGIPGVTESEEENLEFLRTFIRKIGARRVTFVTGSIGTHPAMIWGHKLRVQDIHIVGPVTDYSVAVSTSRGSAPMFQAVTKLAQDRLDSRYPFSNLRPFLSEHSSAVDSVDLYYGRDDQVDCAHAAVIHDLPQVRTTLYHQGDHYRVPAFVQRRDPYMTDRIMAPVIERPADLRRANRWMPVDLGYAEVRLM